MKSQIEVVDVGSRCGCGKWDVGNGRVVNKTFRSETETRPRHLFFSPRRDRDQDLPTFLRDRDETETFEFQPETRPRRDFDRSRPRHFSRRFSFFFVKCQSHEIN